MKQLKNYVRSHMYILKFVKAKLNTYSFVKNMEYEKYVTYDICDKIISRLY